MMKERVILCVDDEEIILRSLKRELHDTLGRRYIIETAIRGEEALKLFEELLTEVLTIRNQLAHSFYLSHNLRRNSEEGRAIMMADLESMHDKLLEAYKAVMLLNGINLDELVAEHGNRPQPVGHLPI